MNPFVMLSSRSGAFVAARLVLTYISRRSRGIASVIACLFFFSVFAQAQTAHFSEAISTLGSGYFAPEGVAVDSSGNVFVADYNHNAVKEVLAASGYTTVITVGSGFSSPQSLAVDSSGNVFVADNNHNAVKEILAAGGYTTVNTLGSGFSHPSGVAVDSSGNVYVADAGNNAVKKIAAAGGYVTVITLGSGFNSPYGVAVDSSANVFVTDAGNNAVKKIAAAGGYVTVTTLGSGFSSPNGVAVDSSGNVFVADTLHNAVKEILAAGGYVTVKTLGSGFSYPYGVAVDGSGNVFVADTLNNVVKEIFTGAVNFASLPVATSTPKTLSLTFTFDTGGTMNAPAVVTQGVTGLDFANAGTGTCTTNGISHTYSASDTCTIDVTFTPSAVGARYGAVRLVNSSAVPIATGYIYGSGLAGQVAFTPGTITTIAGNGSTVSSGMGGPAVNAGFVSTVGVRVDVKGNVYIADESAHKILKVDATSQLISVIAGTGTKGFSGDGGLATNAQIHQPEDVAIDGAGNIYIADDYNNRIRKIDGATGIITTVAGTGTPSDTGDGGLATAATIDAPKTIMVDGAGNLYIGGESLVRRVDAVTGIIMKVAGSTAGYSGDGGPATSAQLDDIYALALDSAGNLYIADGNNSVIRKVDAVSKIITNVAGNGQYGFSGDGGLATSAAFSETFGLAVDSANNIYIADGDNNRIRKVEASTGIVTTIIGSSGQGFAGDGGPATSAQFNFIDALAMDSAGNFYIGDHLNHRIRKVTTGATSLAFASTAVGATSSDSPQTVTVANIGSAALTFVAPSTSLNPSISTGFTYGNSSTCPQLSTVSTPATLASGASCTDLISFSPTVTGSISGSLVTTDNALNAAGPAYVTQSVTLSGTATAPPVSATTAVASAALTQGYAAVAFTPVTGSAQTALTYSIAPALPAGLAFSSAGVVSGTATVASAATTYTVTVTDTNSATGTAIFSLTVNPAITATTAVSSKALTLGRAAVAFTPVTASGGTGALTYTVSPALPAGLSLSSAGVVSGTPTGVIAATTYTITATDTNGATATSTFSLTVNSAITATAALPSTALTLGRAATALSPVTASGGTGTLTYSVVPDLPSGLSFSSAGAVSGTPTAVSAAATYTVTATDTNGATATATFSLTVNPAITATTTAASTVLVQGRVATAFTPVTATGGTGTLTYSVSPALPAGMSLSSAGVVSGTPTGVIVATTFTITATDTNGATGTSTFSLTVNSAITTATAVTASSLTPAYGTAVVLTATITPASTDTPPGTASFYTGSTLLGTVALNASGVATLSIALPLGPNAITVVYSGSARYAGSTSSAVSVSNRTGTAVTFSASLTTQLYNNPIVLTAQVASPTAGTLTGTVSFLDGTTVVATVPVGANGQATYASTALADGGHSLTAAYSGDGNFLPSGSAGAAIAITVGDLNLNLGGDQNRSVLPGAAVSYTFPLSPLVTPTFLYDVRLTATGLPAGATYTFSPATVPAGSATLPITLNVQTAKGVAGLSVPGAPGQQNRSRGLTALAFGLLLPLVGAKRVRKRLKEMPRPLAMILFTALSLGAMAGLTGCGAGGFFGATSTSGKYTITVTATSANLVRTSTVQLTIQ